MNRTVEIDCLRKAVECKLHRRLLAPGDFDMLIAKIAESSNDRISRSTLKRVWGYVSNKHHLRNETLSILARFVGYDDWTDFCEKHSGFVDSDMLVGEKICTSDLEMGDMIEIGWNPDRICQLEYVGNDEFIVRRVEHAKLSVGDSFRAVSFCIGQPLVVSCLKRFSDGHEYSYVAGRRNGLTKLKKL